VILLWRPLQVKRGLPSGAIVADDGDGVAALEIERRTAHEAQARGVDVTRVM
jgi:hypothetical protein